MEDTDEYAVYFFPPALEALGEAIKPFLLDGPTGQHVLCQRIDTAGSLIGMHLYGRNAAGAVVQVELMVPTNMVRMIVSARSDEAFGFGPRTTMKIADVVVPTSAPETKVGKAKPAGVAATRPVPPKRTAAAKKSPAKPSAGKRK